MTAPDDALAAIEARAAAARAAIDHVDRVLADHSLDATAAQDDAFARRDEAMAASAADVPALLAHIAAERERHAAEVAAARAEALREAEGACESVADALEPCRECHNTGAAECVAAIAALGAKGGGA